MPIVDIDVETSPHPVRDQFAKIIIGTTVGFIATKLTESMYDSFVARRRSRKK